MDNVEVNEILERYIRDARESDRPLSEYELGFINGIEYALAMYNSRPVIYTGADKTYSEYDRQKFPEYFL